MHDILTKANRLFDFDDVDEAIKLILDSEFYKNDFKLLNNLGVYYLIASEQCSMSRVEKYYKEAINVFKEAIHLNNTSHYSYSNLGLAYLAYQHYSEARDILVISNNIEKSIINQNNLAVAYYYLQNFNLAQKTLLELLNLIRKTNYFEILQKVGCANENIALFLMLYNYGVICYKLNNTSMTCKIADELYGYYCNKLIALEDVDLLDIVELYYLGGDYQSVLSIFPYDGYVLREKDYFIYFHSCKLLKRDYSVFFEQTLSELDEECEMYSVNENISDSNKIALIQKIKEKKNAIVNLRSPDFLNTGRYMATTLKQSNQYYLYFH